MGVLGARSVGRFAIPVFAPLLAVAGESAAQELGQRIGAVGSGLVTFSYPAREDVEICDRGIVIDGSRTMWSGRRRGDSPPRCARGPVSVELRVEGGLARELDVLHLDELAGPGAVDLGAVGAEEAATYFLALARDGSPGDASEDAVLPAALADVEDLWRDLLDLAKDPGIRRDVREASLFWLGQEAGDAVTAGIAALAADEREEQDVREAAIFALSRRPNDGGVEPLMDIARTAREAETRRAAMFWLAQSDDARVPAFFEAILLGR